MWRRLEIEEKWGKERQRGDLTSIYMLMSLKCVSIPEPLSELQTRISNYLFHFLFGWLQGGLSTALESNTGSDPRPSSISCLTLTKLLKLSLLCHFYPDHRKNGCFNFMV